MLPVRLLSLDFLRFRAQRRVSALTLIALRDSFRLLAVAWLWTHVTAVTATVVVSGFGLASTLRPRSSRVLPVAYTNQPNTKELRPRFPSIQWCAVDIHVRNVITTRPHLRIAPDRLSVPRLRILRLFAQESVDSNRFPGEEDRSGSAVWLKSDEI